MSLYTNYWRYFQKLFLKKLPFFVEVEDENPEVNRRLPFRFTPGFQIGTLINCNLNSNIGLYRIWLNSLVQNALSTMSDRL